MGLTSSLFAGLSGMKTNEFRMDVIGNNIANVNTHSFKAQRATFQTQFSQSFSFGSAPSGSIGGTNPLQVGTGTAVGSINRDFSMGAPEITGRKTDLAIQGQGLFILENSSGAQIFTRDGSFVFNSENALVSSEGLFLMGFGVDTNFNIVEGKLTKLSIPVGEFTTAAVTTHAQFTGDLNANGKSAIALDSAGGDTGLAASGAATRPTLTSQVLYQDAAATTVATDATLLTSIYNANADKLFDTGNIITLAEANKGGANLEKETFTVGTTGTTYANLATWLEDVLGINTSVSLQDLTASNVDNPGVLIPATGGADDGKIKIVGNIGHKNNIILNSKAITVIQGIPTAALPPSSTPLQFTHTVQATTEEGLKDALGESIRTSFRAYDSLGNPMNINITMAMESKGDNGIVWRYFAESADDANADRVLGTGTILFDPNGAVLSGTDLDISIDRTGTGATTPQSLTLDFFKMNGFAMPSAMSLLSQNGFQSGTLSDYSIGQDGIIVGSFDNGLTRSLGQVVLASFRNFEGLIAEADNLFKEGPNSGNLLVKKPLELGTGSIQSASLELSNVDLSREFINLIISSTGFSASSRVIQTSDQLLDELIALTR